MCRNFGSNKKLLVGKIWRRGVLSCLWVRQGRGEKSGKKQINWGWPKQYFRFLAHKNNLLQRFCAYKELTSRVYVEILVIGGRGRGWVGCTYLCCSCCSRPCARPPRPSHDPHTPGRPPPPGSCTRCLCGLYTQGTGVTAAMHTGTKV